MAALPRAGLRFAFGTLTVLPVGGPVAWDRRTAGQGMLCAPVVGLTVGLAAAAAAAVVRELEMGWLLASVAAVAVPAYLSRGLHLDGLADVADGLGSGRPAEEARRVMKRSDTGPFAVVTLVLVLLRVAGVGGGLVWISHAAGGVCGRERFASDRGLLGCIS